MRKIGDDCNWTPRTTVFGALWQMHWFNWAGSMKPFKNIDVASNRNPRRSIGIISARLSSTPENTKKRSTPFRKWLPKNSTGPMHSTIWVWHYVRWGNWTRQSISCKTPSTSTPNTGKRLMSVPTSWKPSERRMRRSRNTKRSLPCFLPNTSFRKLTRTIMNYPCCLTVTSSSKNPFGN